MKAHLILWPLLGQIGLTLFMYLRLAVVKGREIKAGNVDQEATAIDQNMWPDSVRLINNNLRNQFETPILFYVLCILLWAMAAVNTAVMVLACAYVASRIAHAFVHTTSNVVKIRFSMFLLGMIILFVMLGLTAHSLSKLG
jgi:hypothetical protein